jgi:intracellular sulfur oxidation DsrE/DsrF family protein
MKNQEALQHTNRRALLKLTGLGVLGRLIGNVLSHRTVCMLACITIFITICAPKISTAQQQAVTIDIPFELTQAKIVYNIAHATFTASDSPEGLFFLGLTAKTIHDIGAKADLRAVFSAGAGYLLLNDELYNRVRRISTSNPHKGTIKALMDQGVQFEMCGATMKTYGWSNKDLLAGIKVNSGANTRVTQLVQQGFVQFQY